MREGARLTRAFLRDLLPDALREPACRSQESVAEGGEVETAGGRGSMASLVLVRDSLEDLSLRPWRVRWEEALVEMVGEEEGDCWGDGEASRGWMGRVGRVERAGLGEDEAGVAEEERLGRVEEESVEEGEGEVE